MLNAALSTPRPSRRKYQPDVIDPAAADESEGPQDASFGAPPIQAASAASFDEDHGRVGNEAMRVVVGMDKRKLKLTQKPARTVELNRPSKSPWLLLASNLAPPATTEDLVAALTQKYGPVARVGRRPRQQSSSVHPAIAAKAAALYVEFRDNWRAKEAFQRSANAPTYTTASVRVKGSCYVRMCLVTEPPSVLEEIPCVTPHGPETDVDGAFAFGLLSPRAGGGGGGGAEFAASNSNGNGRNFNFDLMEAPGGFDDERERGPSPFTSGSSFVWQVSTSSSARHRSADGESAATAAAAAAGLEESTAAALHGGLASARSRRRQERQGGDVDGAGAADVDAAGDGNRNGDRFGRQDYRVEIGGDGSGANDVGRNSSSSRIGDGGRRHERGSEAGDRRESYGRNGNDGFGGSSNNNSRFDAGGSRSRNDDDGSKPRQQGRGSESDGRAFASATMDHSNSRNGGSGDGFDRHDLSASRGRSHSRNHAGSNNPNRYIDGGSGRGDRERERDRASPVPLARNGGGYFNSAHRDSPRDFEEDRRTRSAFPASEPPQDSANSNGGAWDRNRNGKEGPGGAFANPVPARHAELEHGFVGAGAVDGNNGGGVPLAPSYAPLPLGPAMPRGPAMPLGPAVGPAPAPQAAYGANAAPAAASPAGSAGAGAFGFADGEPLRERQGERDMEQQNDVFYQDRRHVDFPSQEPSPVHRGGGGGVAAAFPGRGPSGAARVFFDHYQKEVDLTAVLPAGADVVAIRYIGRDRLPDAPGYIGEWDIMHSGSGPPLPYGWVWKRAGVVFPPPPPLACMPVFVTLQAHRLVLEARRPAPEQLIISDPQRPQQQQYHQQQQQEQHQPHQQHQQQYQQQPHQQQQQQAMHESVRRELQYLNIRSQDYDLMPPPSNSRQEAAGSAAAAGAPAGTETSPRQRMDSGNGNGGGSTLEGDKRTVALPTGQAPNRGDWRRSDSSRERDRERDRDREQQRHDRASTARYVGRREDVSGDGGRRGESARRYAGDGPRRRTEETRQQERRQPPRSSDSSNHHDRDRDRKGKRDRDGGALSARDVSNDTRSSYYKGDTAAAGDRSSRSTAKRPADDGFVPGFSDTAKRPRYDRPRYDRDMPEAASAQRIPAKGRGRSRSVCDSGRREERSRSGRGGDSGGSHRDRDRGNGGRRSRSRDREVRGGGGRNRR